MKSKNKALNIQDIRNLAAEFYKTLEAERVALRARVAELESERDAVRQQAGDATEYVLAQMNNDLRARIAELERALRLLIDHTEAELINEDDIEFARQALAAPAPSPEWVKVSERLPEKEDADESGMCWMFSADEGVCTMLAEFAFEFEDQFGVTHWMPKPRQQLPEPPAEVDDD